MSWITLTTEDLQQYLASAQVKALQTRALGALQTDPVPEFITQAATRVRMAIASASGVLQATPYSVPPSLKSTVAALALEQAQTRLPGLSLTREQLSQASLARGVLTQLSQGKLAYEAPDEPTQTIATPSTLQLRVVKKRSSKNSASAWRGL